LKLQPKAAERMSYHKIERKYVNEKSA
jgi:hypothetical protein